MQSYSYWHNKRLCCKTCPNTPFSYITNCFFLQIWYWQIFYLLPSKLYLTSQMKPSKRLQWMCQLNHLKEDMLLYLKKTCPIAFKIREIRPKQSRMQYMEWINVGKMGYQQGSKGRLFITNLLCLNLIKNQTKILHTWYLFFKDLTLLIWVKY
jgi:hypothetical protein